MTTFTERRQRVTDSGELVLLEITSPSMGATLRLARDTQDWAVGGHTYLGLPFRFKLPDDVSGQTPAAQLEIDNVGRDMTADLEGLPPNEIMTARILITDRESPDDIEQTLVLPMSSVSVTPTVATARCGMDYIMRRQCVQLRANPFTLPGIF